MSSGQDIVLRVFLGYDERMPAGGAACMQSIMDHTTMPVQFTPMRLKSMTDHFTRPKAPGQMTDFTYVRFIAPLLCNFEGWCLFIDGNDMMVRTDLRELWDLRDDKYGVMVVKHPEFSGEHSFMGNAVKTYPMLNWSSVMLMNCARCKKLTKEYVDTASYMDLHQFKWLDSPAEIGELPSAWNHLVRYYPPREDVKLVHWTMATPLEKPHEEKADEWYEIRDRLLANPDAGAFQSQLHNLLYSGACLALIALIAGGLRQKT